MIRKLATSGFAALLISAGLLLSPTAWGHAQFVGSDPAAESTLENSPHAIVLTFSQAVTPVTVTLVSPDGSMVERVAEPQANGSRVILPVTAPLGAGQYLVSFRVLSGDSHPISGGFRFSVAPAPTEAAASAPATVPDRPIALPDSAAMTATEDASSLATLEQIVRFAFMATLLLAAGLVLFRLLIALPDELDAWIVSLIRKTSYAGLLLVVAYFALATLAVTGIEAFQLQHLYVLLQTSIGMSLMVALLGFLMLSMSGASERILSGIGASVLVASRVLTGHPASQDPTWVLVPGMAVHVAAAAFWFAALWVILRLLQKGPIGAAPKIIAGFARTAAWSVFALLLAGFVMALIHLSSIDALLHTDYGRLVMWKLLGVGGLLLLALINKLVLTPDFLKRLDTARLKTSIRVEAGLMIGVIALSTLLAATPPGSRAETPLPQSSTARVEVLSDTGQFVLQVDFSSAVYDETQPLSLTLYDDAGAPFTPLEVALTVSIPSRRIESLPLPIVRREGNHVVIDADFPDAADTHFEALVLVTDFDRERFAFDREGRLE